MNEKKYLENQNETMGENLFMKKLLKKRLNQKGLTLIELLAVIVILAIVAAIAVPAIGNIINNSEIKTVKSDALMILNAANLERSSDGTDFSASGVETVKATYLESAGELAGKYKIDVDANKNLTISTTSNIDAGGKKVKITNGTLQTIKADSAEADTVVTFVTTP